ncbi:mitochondrial inner membrane protease subunit 2 isoform X16 [Homo sapiens]|uniref:mitochondrial inner membrane protease subunit 2 isoform X16 n=1 Tax=Homo sapiens TaxID=9606 RepID=UPI0023DF8237|nr:mitochondrial inner membrane protease subunit 2 isoform X16 [Homo sapiens]XP_054215155.1 mitochondrial inner membrane protease subunit 2 isoform X16 [Homo sapiens]XP_054215156.1 mitochondrial inner membrane protease subunit 2 isoform X16 [Homo sapiens]
MAQSQGWVKRYIKAFCKGFFVAVPVAVTFLDRVACVARVEGASMQPSLNPGGSQSSDVVLLNHWKVRNFEVHRGDIVSLVSPKNPEQKIIKRVIALEGDIVRTIGHKNRYVKVPRGHIWVEGDHHGHSFDSNSFGPCHICKDHSSHFYQVNSQRKKKRFRKRKKKNATEFNTTLPSGNKGKYFSLEK